MSEIFVVSRDKWKCSGIGVLCGQNRTGKHYRSIYLVYAGKHYGLFKVKELAIHRNLPKGIYQLVVPSHFLHHACEVEEVFVDAVVAERNHVILRRISVIPMPYGVVVYVRIPEINSVNKLNFRVI